MSLVGKGKQSTDNCVAVVELDSVLFSACSCFINCKALLPLIGVELARGPWGTLFVCGWKERRGRVVWTDPEMR